MFAPKATQGEKEYKNEILVWNPFYDSNLTKEKMEEKRNSDLDKGHVYLSFDPAETNIGTRQCRYFKDKIQPEKSLRCSIYNDPREFVGEKIPSYGFLDECLCNVCRRKASYFTLSENFGTTYYCGTHCTKKNFPDRREVLRGRSKSEFINDDSKWKNMFEYENLNRFLDNFDYKEVRGVIIETQMAINYRSTRMSQFLITSIMQRLKTSGNPYFPLIYEISPKIKSRVYGVKLPKPELKKWTVRKAIYNAVRIKEREFLKLVVVDEWHDKLIEMYENGELTELVLWDLVEPERNFTTTKDKTKAKKDCILTRAGHDLFDICDAKEQIESFFIETGMDKMYYLFPNKEEKNKEDKTENKGKKRGLNLPII